MVKTSVLIFSSLLAASLHAHSSAAEGAVTGPVVGLDVMFPPERHVFRHADEVQFALQFDVESPEVPYCDNTTSRPNVPVLPGSCKHIMHAGFASTCGSLSSVVAPMPACPGLL